VDLTLARRKPKTWTCPKCKRKNEVRTSSRTCQFGCGATKPPPRVTKAKPRETFTAFDRVNAGIHGVTDGSCGVCGKPPSEHRKNDRDHCHVTGRPRGLACPGNSGCNVLMAKWITAPVARAIAAAKLAAGERDAERWEMVASYLERVDAYYAQ
jgi:hypothetical protein